MEIQVESTGSGAPVLSKYLAEEQTREKKVVVFSGSWWCACLEASIEPVLDYRLPDRLLFSRRSLHSPKESIRIMSPLSRVIIMNTILSSRKKNRRKTRIELPPTEHHQYDGDDDHNREGISSSRKKRGMQVARCSFSTYDQPKKYLVISYGEDVRKFISVPIDTLIPAHTNPIPSSLSLDDYHTLDLFMSCILVGETLYFFGGINTSQQVLKTVCRSVLSNLSAFMETGKITYCRSMRCGTYLPLLFKVDDDRIFVFGRKNVHLPFRHVGDYFTLQEYIIQKDAWSLIVDDNNPLGFDMDKFDCDYTTRATPNLLPHVVIGHKLHISFGNSSFSFDTVKRAWEDCGLFETFWSNSGYTPSDFYGGKGYAGPGGKKPEQGEKKKGGPPLGFYGRAILWDNKNILLGAHYAETGRRIPVVAFLLDDNLTSVVKSQPLYLTLPDKESIAFSGRLVDLGRDGYFGYTHFYPVDETDDDEKKYGRDWHLMITSWNVKSSEDKLLQKKLQCRNGSSLMPSERTVIPVYVMHQRVILHEMKKKAGAAGFSQKRVSAVKFGGILCRIVTRQRARASHGPGLDCLVSDCLNWAALL
ncbi:hypothetical protein V2J09_011598 [Rumex salicifolius]